MILNLVRRISGWGPEVRYLPPEYIELIAVSRPEALPGLNGKFPGAKLAFRSLCSLNHLKPSPGRDRRLWHFPFRFQALYLVFRRSAARKQILNFLRLRTQLTLRCPKSHSRMCQTRSVFP